MCGRYRLKDPKKAFDWFEVVPSSDFPTTVQHSTQPHPLGPASGLRLHGPRRAGGKVFGVWSAAESRAGGDVAERKGAKTL